LEAGHVDTEVRSPVPTHPGALAGSRAGHDRPSGISFDTGINPSSVAVGDLNADGKPDLRASRGNSSRSGDSWAVRPL